MLGPNDPLNPDIPDPDASMPNLPPAEEPEDEYGEGDPPAAVPGEPAESE